MKKDIKQPVVKDIAVAVIQEENQAGEKEWNVYLINLKKKNIDVVIVTSQGYGIYNNEDVKTSELRHYLGEIEGNSFLKIEPILENLFGLTNQYWVSFYSEKILYDKKYIFLPETIKEENFTVVPIIHKKGVMIK